MTEHISKINTEEKRLPTESAVLLKTYFNLTASDLEKKARDITEINPPQTQGTNAYLLSEFIISKGDIVGNPWYKQATFFKNNYKSNTCYICGGQIQKLKKNEELEHLLPVVEALGFNLIIQQDKKSFIRTFENIYNKDVALGYLLEYARSHRCCNQIKGKSCFFTFNGTPPFEKPYVIDKELISKVLKNIWLNARIEGKLYSELYGCQNDELISYMSGISKDYFIKERKLYLINNYFQPLLDFVYERIREYGKGSFPLAQLVAISNQAMSIDQTVWEKLGLQWKGDIITKGQLFEKIYSEAIAITYDESRKININKLLSIGELKQICFIFFDKRRKGRNTRNIDIQYFSKFIDIDYKDLIDIVLLFLKTYNLSTSKSVTEADRPLDNCLFGITYMELLFNAQDQTFKFYEDMIPFFKEMMINVNNYTMLKLYAYIVYFDILSNKSFPNEKELEEFNEFISNNGKMASFVEIHDNFANNTFENLNYALLLNKKVALEIKNINNYVNFILMGFVQVDYSNIIVDFSDSAEYKKKIDHAVLLLNFNKSVADEYEKGFDVNEENKKYSDKLKLSVAPVTGQLPEERPMKRMKLLPTNGGSQKLRSHKYKPRTKKSRRNRKTRKYNRY
jgi:hypothetical protein